jgi:fatty acid desaturase
MRVVSNGLANSTVWFEIVFFLLGSSNQSSMAAHFWPESPALFKKENRSVVVVSVACVLLTVALIVSACFVWGFVAVFKVYLFPYFVNNAWFIMYTFLHHTHKNVPHYDAGEWSYIRGALATVDRDYGIADHLHHRIGSTHVLHHLFKVKSWIN